MTTERQDHAKVDQSSGASGTTSEPSHSGPQAALGELFERKVAQRKAARGGSAEGPATAPAASGSGSPLPDGVRGKMEGAFNQDFSDVRVHAGSQHAPALGAQAYTQGSDIHFAPGHYDTGSRGGQELLGHELTHVVQQRAGRVATPQGKAGVVNADAGLEAEADALGARAARGESVTVSGSSAGLQRKAAGPIQLKKATTPDGMAKEMAEALDDPLITSRFSELADYLCDKQWQAFKPQLQDAYRTISKKPTWDVAALRTEIAAKYSAPYKKDYLLDLFDNGFSSPLQQIYLGLGLVTGSPSAASFTGFFGIRQASERETVLLVERHYEHVKGNWATLDPLLKGRLGPVHYDRLVKFKAMKDGDAATLAQAQAHPPHGHAAPTTAEQAIEHGVEHAQDALNTHLTAGPQAASGLTAGTHTNAELLGGVDHLHADLDTKAAKQTAKDAEVTTLTTAIGGAGVKGSLTQKFDAQNTKRTALVDGKAQKETALGQVGTPGLAETAHQARVKADADRQLARAADDLVTQLKASKATKVAIENAKSAAKGAKAAAARAEKSAVEAERARAAIEEQIKQLGTQLTATDGQTSDYSKAKAALDKATNDKATAVHDAGAAKTAADAARTAATDADTKLKAIRDLVSPRIGYLAAVITSYKTKTLNPELVEDIRGWCEQNEETGAREWAIVDPKSAFLAAIQPFKPRDQQYLKSLVRGEDDAAAKAALDEAHLSAKEKEAIPDVLATRATVKREQQKNSEKTVKLGIHHRKLKAQLNELGKDARDVYLVEVWNEAEAAKAKVPVTPPTPAYQPNYLNVTAIQAPGQRATVVDGPFTDELKAGGVSGKDLEDIKGKFLTLQDSAGSSYVRLHRNVVTTGRAGWTGSDFGDKALLLVSHLRPDEYVQVRADDQVMDALAACTKKTDIAAILGVDFAAQTAKVSGPEALQAGAVGHYKDEAELNPKHWSTLLDVEIGRNEYFAREENRQNLNHVVLLMHGAQMAAYRDAARNQGEKDAVHHKDKEDRADPVAKAFMLAVYLGMNDKSRASIETNAPAASAAMQQGNPVTVDMVLAAVTRHHFLGNKDWHAIWVRKQDLIQSFEQCNGSELLHEWSNYGEFGKAVTAIDQGASTTKDKDKKDFARGFTLDVRPDRREFIKKTLGSEEAAIDVCNQLRTKLKLAMEHDHLFKDAYGEKHGGVGLENNEFSRDRVEMNGLVEAADLRENSWQMQHFSAKGALLQGQKRALRHNVTTTNKDISTQLDLHDQQVASGQAAPGATPETVADTTYAPRKEELGKDKEAVSRSMEAFDTLREKVKKYTEIALAILLTIAVTASTLGAGGLPAAALLGVKIAAAAAVKLAKRFVEHILSNDTAEVSQILFELVGDMAGVALTGAVAYASTAATAAAQIGPMDNFKDNPFAKEAFKAFVKESMLIPVNELKQRATARTQVDTPVGKWVVDKLKAYAVEFAAAEATATYVHFTDKPEAPDDPSAPPPPAPTVGSLMEKDVSPAELVVDATAEEIGDSAVEATESEDEGERAKRKHVGHSTRVASWNYQRFELKLSDSTKPGSAKPWDQWPKDNYPKPKQWLAANKGKLPNDPKGYAQVYAPDKGGFLLPGDLTMNPALETALTPAAAAPCDPKVTAALDKAILALDRFQRNDKSVKLSDVRNALMDLDRDVATLPDPWTKKLPDKAKVTRLKTLLDQVKPTLDASPNKSDDVTVPAVKVLTDALAKYDVAVADTATLVPS